MYLWLLIGAALILQESATTAIVLLLAYQNHLPFWPIHLIWIAAAMLDMYAGFTLGTLLKRRFREGAFFDRIERWVTKIKQTLGTHGEQFSLALLGIINFSYLNTFLAAWLGLPMNIALIVTLIGNFIWYILIWAAVLGLDTFVSNPNIILLIIVGLCILSHLLFKFSKRGR